MDPKNLSQLDPKLREVYERVMGTSNPVKPQPAQNPPQNPTLSNETPPVSSAAPVSSQNIVAEPIMSSSPTFSPSSNAAPAESDSASPSPKVEMSIKPKAKVSPLIIGVAAVVFLVVYTLIWIKVFNLQLPFLP